MRVLIADDEPLARMRLEALLRECSGAELVGSVGDAEAVLTLLPEVKPDVLLLDIEMPGLSGLDLAHRLKALPAPPQVVFCTAYEQHAVSAFDLAAADYLVKPVRGDRLCAALRRAAQRRVEAPATPSRRDHLCARIRGELKRVPLNAVLCLLADDKYVTVHHRDGSLLIEESLKQLDLEFPGRFVRLHRNCLVPRERLLGLKSLPDGRTIAQIAGCDLEPEISRRKLPALRELLRVE
jgi:two-component system response regulator AlgR